MAWQMAMEANEVTFLISNPSRPLVPSSGPAYRPWQTAVVVVVVVAVAVVVTFVVHALLSESNTPLYIKKTGGSGAMCNVCRV